MKTSKETLSNYLVLSNNRYYNNNSLHNSFLSYGNSFSTEQLIYLLELPFIIINILILAQFFHRVHKNLSLLWTKRILYKVFHIQRVFIILLLFRNIQKFYGEKCLPSLAECAARANDATTTTAA